MKNERQIAHYADSTKRSKRSCEQFSAYADPESAASIVSTASRVSFPRRPLVKSRLISIPFHLHAPRRQPRLEVVPKQNISADQFRIAFCRNSLLLCDHKIVGRVESGVFHGQAHHVQLLRDLDSPGFSVRQCPSESSACCSSQWQ